MIRPTTNKFFPILLLIFVAFVAYFNRHIFLFKFEPDYWENYYYESQWNVPNSQREISDEGVYRYIGYRLVNGENPFNVDYWVPPFGKYLYGLGAKYLTNPYLTSFTLYLLAILLFNSLARLLFPDKKISYPSLYLFVLNPLIVVQISQTMLDLPLLIAFLAHLLFTLQFGKNKKSQDLLLSGFFLGLMAGIKPPFYIPFIALVDLWFIWRIKGLTSCFLFLPTIIGGYLASYFCYFFRHPNPIPWLRLHQKIIDFQKGHAGSHYPLNIFTMIFLGQFKGLLKASFVKMKMTEWSAVFPLGTISSLFILFKKSKPKKNLSWLYLAFLSLVYLFSNSLVDVWPRYLVPLVPLLILTTTHLFKNKSWLLYLLLLSYLPFLLPIFSPDPKPTIENFSQLLLSGRYRDAYQILSQSDKKEITEDQWQSSLTNLNFQKENLINQVETIKEGNQWRIKWNPEKF